MILIDYTCQEKIVEVDLSELKTAWRIDKPTGRLYWTALRNTDYCLQKISWQREDQQKQINLGNRKNNNSMEVLSDSQATPHTRKRELS